MINGKKIDLTNDEPVTGQTARQDALEAIEHRHGAYVRRDAIPGTFRILDSFRVPNGVWWLRIVCLENNREAQKFATPAQQFTPLKPGTEIQLTKVTCGDCSYYEVS